MTDVSGTIYVPIIRIRYRCRGQRWFLKHQSFLITSVGQEPKISLTLADIKASDLTSFKLISYKEVTVKDMVLPFREQRSPVIMALAPWNKMRL
jgi:hypothetical protein